MIAFGASLALLIYFGVVGTAIAAALHSQRDLVRNMLIAPALGVCATILPAYMLSRAGLPVSAFARPQALATLALAGAALLWRRPQLPRRPAAAFAGIALAALLANGWPLLLQGFGWIGAVNPDMTNYVLTATRFVHHGYLEAPDPQAWMNQTDWSLYFIGFQLAANRSGPDLLLAWTMVVTGVDGTGPYMPLLLALHVALIGAATALLPTRARYARLLAAGLLAASSMMTLGVTLQLIGQVLGLIMLALAAVLFFTPVAAYRGAFLARFIALGGFVLGTYLTTYPETLPFFGFAFLLYHGQAGPAERRSWPRGIAVCAGAGLVGCLLIFPDVLGFLNFTVSQAVAGSVGRQHAQLFPYFLVPSGLAALWGMIRFTTDSGRWAAAAVGISAVLSCLAIAAVAAMARRRQPSALIAVPILLLGLLLLLGSSGFGTLKVAMYVQPFVLPAVILALCTWLRAWR